MRAPPIKAVAVLDENSAMVLTARMLTPDTWEDFAALVESNNGVWGGCWCMGFYPGGSAGTSLARIRRWDGKTWFGINLVPDAAGVTIRVGDEVEVLEAVPPRAADRSAPCPDQARHARRSRTAATASLIRRWFSGLRASSYSFLATPM